MIDISLTQPQREELTRLSHQAIGRVALRAHMVLLSDRGFTVPQIAAIHACGEDVVRTWLHRYEQQGVAGLEDEPRSGRPLKHPLEGWIVDTGGESIATLFGARADVLECCLAHHFLVQTLSFAPLPYQYPAVAAPDGLALEASSAGSRPQA
jgi:hypothetical protein